MSVLEIITTTISSTTSIALLESSATTLTPTSESVSEAEESPSMFSTSMTPTRLSPTGKEEELITTVSPTIKEEHEDTDDVTVAPDFNIYDFVSENVAHEESAPHRGDTFSKPQHTTESTATTESVATPFEEPDNQSIIEISTIQPDVPIPDASLSTEPMYAKGNTEETILDGVITTAMTSDLTDTPTESNELTSGEVFSSPESPSTTWLHSTTPFTDYDDIETGFALEALPPTPPPQRDLTSGPLDSSSIIDGTTTPSAITSYTTFMCDTQPGSEVEITTTEPPKTTSTATQSTPQTQDVETPAIVYKEETTPGAATASSAPIDVGTSAEDMTSPTSVRVFDEFTGQVPEHSGDSLTEDGTVTEMGTDFFTSAPIASAVADKTTTPGAVVADEQSIQVTVIMQNVSEEPTKILASTEIPDVDVDEFDPDIITEVASTPPDILPEEDELIIKDPTQTDTTSVPASTVEDTVSKSTQKTEAGQAPTDATEGMSDVTSTSADFVPTVTPTEPQITKATKETQTPKVEKETTSVITTSVQRETGETGRTPTYVKNDSEVTQTEKAEDQSSVTSSTKLYTARDKAETTEDVKSTSATPAAEDSTVTALQTVYTPSAGDPEGKTPTSTASDSQSTQDVEEEKEIQAPKEFAFSTTAPSVSSGSSSPEQTAKTEITPAIDLGSTESSASVAPILAEISPDEDGSGGQTEEIFPETSSVTAKSSLYSTEAQTTTSPVTSSAVSDSEDKDISSETTMLYSTEAHTTTSPVTSSDISGSTVKPETASFPITTDSISGSTVKPETASFPITTDSEASSLYSTEKPRPMPSTASGESQNKFPFSTATNGSQIAESQRTSQPGVESSTQTIPQFMTDESTDAPQFSSTIEAVPASVSESGIGDFTDVESSGDDTSASTDETPLETPTASDQSSVEQTTLAITTFRPLVTTTFVEEKSSSDREFTTVTTSPYTFETSQLLAIPSVTVYTSKETSTFIDMETSGGSADEEESSSDGSGEVVSIETTSKPQEEVTVATDETEIDDTERTSDMLSVASSTHSSTQLTKEFMSSTQSPHMTSTEMYNTEQGSGFPDDSLVEGESSGVDLSVGSTTFKPLTSSPVMPTAVAARTEIMSSSSDVAITEEGSRDQTTDLSIDNVITQKPTAASSLHSTDNPTAMSPEMDTTTVQESSAEMFPQTSSSTVYNTESPAVTLVASSALSDIEDKEIKSTTSSLFSTKKPKTITVLHESASAQSVNVSVSATDESPPSSAFTLTEGESSGDQTTEMFTSKPSLMDSVTFGEATGETETFVSVTPTSDEQVSSQEVEITPDTHSSITSEATEPPVSSIGKDTFTVAEHITQSSYTTMSPHTIGASVSDHSTVDFTTVSSSSEHKPDGFTSMSSPVPSIIYHRITDQQVVIITPSSSHSKTDLTEQTPTMVLHVSKPSTSTTIIFTEDAKDEDELFSTVTDNMKEGSITPERITKDAKIIDADTISIVPSSSFYPTIQTEEAGGVTPVTMTRRLEVTEESEGSGTDRANFFTPKPENVHATSTNDLPLASTSSEYLPPTSKPSTVEGVSSILTSGEETVTSAPQSTPATTLSTKSSSEETYGLTTPHTVFSIGTHIKPVLELVEEDLSGNNVTESITEIAASSSLPPQTLTEITDRISVAPVSSEEYMISTIEKSTVKPSDTEVITITDTDTSSDQTSGTLTTSTGKAKPVTFSVTSPEPATNRTEIAVSKAASSLYSTDKPTDTPSPKDLQNLKKKLLLRQHLLQTQAQWNKL
ncbi:uncharacterized protein LOC142957657 [Anarhichas minor]|uniref:uncharacterized protein LOC142957657 n=1 Tax=Anarhichas minor TaxID=65739 RepID=UPI003F731FC6